MDPTLDTCFEHIVVINLATRADRRREMQAQLQRIGLGLTSPGAQLFEAVKPEQAAGFDSTGARGCFMSHLQVLRLARDQGWRSVLLLEDDLNFCADFAPRFAALAPDLSTGDWGMFYGSYSTAHAPAFAPRPWVAAEPTLELSTTAFVAVQGHHIALLVRYLEAMLARPPGDPLGGPMHIDGAYCWFRRAHPGMATWLANPPLGYQRASRTDIHPLRWFDRQPWSAALVAGLRRLRNRWQR